MSCVDLCGLLWIETHDPSGEGRCSECGKEQEQDGQLDLLGGGPWNTATKCKP